MNILSVAEMKEAEEYTCATAGVTMRDLINNAAAALAEFIGTEFPDKRAVFVCGVGNNGEDGRTAAEILGADIIDAKELTGAHMLTGYDIIVDAIFGTGLNRAPEGAYAEAIRAINNSRAIIISVDVPSGLNADNGQIYAEYRITENSDVVKDCDKGISTARKGRLSASGASGRAEDCPLRGGQVSLAQSECVRADFTVAFGAIKRGLILALGRDTAGKIIVRDAGIILPAKNYPVLAQNFVIPMRRSYSHKGTYANVKIIAGSSRYPGAAFLCSQAALRCGAGLVTLGAPESLMSAYAARTKENTLFPLPDKAGGLVFDENILKEFITDTDVIAAGPGLGRGNDITEITRYLLKNFGGKLLLDADALNTLDLTALRGAECQIALTPHIAEFARLLKRDVKEILNNPIDLAVNFAKNYNCILVLKSNSTIITDGINTVIAASAPPSLAKGGSGDVLTGIICGLSGILGLFDACVAGCILLSKCAAEYAAGFSAHSLTASDIIKAIPKVLKRHESRCGY